MDPITERIEGRRRIFNVAHPKCFKCCKFEFYFRLKNILDYEEGDREYQAWIKKHEIFIQKKRDISYSQPSTSNSIRYNTKVCAYSDKERSCENFRTSAQKRSYQDDSYPAEKYRRLEQNLSNSPGSFAPAKFSGGLDFDIIKQMEPDDEMLAYVQKMSYNYAKALENRYVGSIKNSMTS